jgi:phosphoesterase RecJ-like protein
MMANLLEDLEAFKALIHGVPKYIVTFTHKNPDGDAIGSSLAIRRYLESFGHTVRTILPSDYPKMFDFLPGMNDVLIGEIHHDGCRSAIKMADTFICLDFNSLDRIDWLAQEMIESKGTKILIDHHIDPEPFADLMFSDPMASSTAELVYYLIDQMGDDSRIDTDAAEALYTGILTDTGSYKYSTSSRLFQIAARLKEKGVDDYMLNIRLFNNMSEKQLRLLGHCLVNRMEVLDELSTGIIYLDKEDFKNYLIARGDTEGIVNYILMMRHIRVAILVTEQNQLIKLSFRSKGNISVQYLAHKYFRGGGHKNASGGASRKSLEETLKYLKDILPEFIQNQLNYV